MMNGGEGRRRFDVSPRSHLYSTPRRFAGSLRHIAAEIEKRGRHQDSDSSDSDFGGTPRITRARPVPGKQPESTARPNDSPRLPSPRIHVNTPHGRTESSASKGSATAPRCDQTLTQNEDNIAHAAQAHEHHAHDDPGAEAGGERQDLSTVLDSQVDERMLKKEEFRLFDSQKLPSPSIPQEYLGADGTVRSTQDTIQRVHDASHKSPRLGQDDLSDTPRQQLVTSGGHGMNQSWQSMAKRPPVSVVAAELRERERRLQSIPDVIETRNTRVPVARCQIGPHHDVEGDIVEAPEAFSAQVLKEYSGKILMVDSNRKPIPVLSAAAVGARGLVVVYPHPEPIAPVVKDADVGLPVVGIAEHHAKRIFQGDFGRILFNARRRPDCSASVEQQDPLSQSAPRPPAVPHKTPRTEHSAEQARVRGRSSMSAVRPASARRSPHARSFLWDSDSDEDVDAEFLLCRRRRFASPQRSPSRASGLHAPQGGDEAWSKPRTQEPRTPPVHRDLSYSETPYVPRDLTPTALDDVVKNLEFGDGHPNETETIQGLTHSLLAQDAQGMAGYLLRIEASAAQLLPGEMLDRFVVHFVGALGTCFSQHDVELQEEAQGRLRELCRERGSRLSARVVSAVACYPAVLRSLLFALEPAAALFRHNRTEGREKERRHQARLAAATVLRHVALDPAAARALSKEGEALGMLGAVLLHGSDEEVVHKVAACTANAALEYPPSRRELCSANGVLEGLGRLLLTDSPRCIASALAALSNLSLDSELACKVARQLHIPRLVMLLLSGANKAKHRGAGLVRNLLLAEETRQRLVQRGPGLMKALQQLKRDSSCGSETQKRASVALSLLIEQLHRDGSLDNVSMVERKLMNSQGPLADQLTSSMPERDPCEGEQPRVEDETLWTTHGEGETAAIVEAQVVSVMEGQELLQHTRRGTRSKPPHPPTAKPPSPRTEVEAQGPPAAPADTANGREGKARWVWRGAPEGSEDDWIGWDTTGRSETPRDRQAEDTGASTADEHAEELDRDEKLPAPPAELATAQLAQAEPAPAQPKVEPAAAAAPPPVKVRSLPAKKGYAKRDQRKLSAESSDPGPTPKSVRSRERSGSSIFRLSSDSDSSDSSPLPAPRTDSTGQRTHPAVLDRPPTVPEDATPRQVADTTARSGEEASQPEELAAAAECEAEERSRSPRPEARVLHHRITPQRLAAHSAHTRAAQRAPAAGGAGEEAKDGVPAAGQEAGGGLDESQPVYISARQQLSLEGEGSPHAARDGARSVDKGGSSVAGASKAERTVCEEDLLRIAGMLASCDRTQLQQAAAELRELVDAQRGGGRRNKREIAGHSGLLTVMGQLLEDGVKVSLGGGQLEEELLEVLRDVCEGDEENVRKFVENRQAAGGVLQVLRRCRRLERRMVRAGPEEARTGGRSEEPQRGVLARKRVAGELVSLCVVDDQAWQLLCSARDYNKLRSFGEWARRSPPRKAPAAVAARQSRTVDL